MTDLEKRLTERLRRRDDTILRMHVALSEILEAESLDWAKSRSLVALPSGPKPEHDKYDESQ